MKMERRPFLASANDLELVTPASLVRLWPGPGADDDVLARCREAVATPSGVYWLREGLLAVVPVSGDPAIHDVALRLVERLRVAAGNGAPGLQAAVVAGSVSRRGERVQEEAGSLLADLDRRALDLSAGEVAVSSRVATRLEIPRRLERRRTYRGVSGTKVPFLTVGPEDPDGPPFRSPTLFRHPVARVRRPDVEGMLRALQGTPVLRVSGPAGCGKTRAVYEALRERGYPAIHVVARPERQGGPGIGAQVLHRRTTGELGAARPDRLLDLVRRWGLEDADRLCEPDVAPAALVDPAEMAKRIPEWVASLGGEGRPPVLVLDQLEAVTPEDLELMAALAGAVADRDDLRLVLVARPGAPWSRKPPFRDTPEVPVTAMEPEEMTRFSEAACKGLPLPGEMVARFIDEAQGNPFAFEEGLTALAERDLVHEVHGSLLYRGGREASYAPSARLAAHVEAEVGRFGDALPLRMLSLVRDPVPDRALHSAARRAGATLGAGWPGPFVDGGLVREADGPWGSGLLFACAAHGAALRGGLAPPAAQELRRLLGESLADETTTGSWRTFQLLEGTPAALDPLVASARDPTVPRTDLIAALDAELARRREEGLDEETELDLLWTVLPMLRNQDRLAGRRADLERAVALASQDPAKRAALVGLQAELAEDEGRLGDAETLLRSALESVRGGGGDSARALLVLRLARVLVRRERYREARTLLERTIPVFDGSGARALAASGRFLLANVALHENRLEESLRLHNQALEARRRLDRPRQTGISLSALGAVTLQLGRYTESLACYREAEEVFRESGDVDQVSFALLGIGRALSRTGDFIAAARPLRSALSIRETCGDKVGEAFCRLAVAENHLHLGRPGTALEEARRAHFDLTFHSAAVHVADAEQLLGRILLMRRDLREARKHLMVALDAHRRLHNAEASAFDLAWLLMVEVQAEERYEVSRLVAELEGALAACARAERREVLEVRLFQGLEVLGRAEEGRVHLERAYEALLEKTGHLPAELRHRFLHGVREHEILVQAATRLGVAKPSPARG